MNKKILVVALLLLFSTFAFATSSNSLQSFGLSWNPNTNQLNINAQCKAQAIATLSLSNGMSKTIICSSMDLGETWLLGDQSTIESITGTLTIDQPCDMCSRTATITLADPSNQGDMFSPMVVFIIVMVIVVVVLLFVVQGLQR